MKSPIALSILCLCLTGCGPCPRDCTAKAVAECENQSAIFRAKVAEAIDQNPNILSRLALKEDGVGRKFEEKDEQKVASIIEQKQLEWDQAQIHINSTIDQNDLEKICTFMKNETVSLTLLQELEQIGRKKEQYGKNIEQKIVDDTVNEINKNISN